MNRRPISFATAMLAAALASAAARADIVAGLEEFGELTLVDSVECATDASHQRRDYPAGRSFITNILGEACVAMRHVAKSETALGNESSSYLAWRIGKGVVPNDPYILAIEYPDDAPRSATVMNFGNWTHHGFATGFAVPDCMSPPYVAQVLESYAIPLSNEFRTFKEVMFPMQQCQQVESAVKDNALLFDLPQNGFDVVFALFPQEDSTDSTGVAVKSIRLYHIDDYTAAAPEIHYPIGNAPRRHVTFREEMGDNYAMQGYPSGKKALAYQAKARLMTLLGVDTLSRDMLEFGYLQGWDSSYDGSGNNGNFAARKETVQTVRAIVTDADSGVATTNSAKYTSYESAGWYDGPTGQIDDHTVITVTTNTYNGYHHWASSSETWGEIIAFMAEEGHYILPYYEYSGSRGSYGWGSQGRRPMMLNTEGYGSGQGWSNQSWINAATADLTEEGTRADFEDILNLTLLRYANTPAYTNMFLGAWMRNRAQVPMGFSDRAVARFAADEAKWLTARGYDPASVTRLSINQALLAKKAQWIAENGSMSDVDGSQYYRWGCDIYNHYREWWYLRRRDFFAAMRNYMTTNGIPDARMFYHSCTAEPGEQWDSWWPTTSIYAGEGEDCLWNGIDWKECTGRTGNTDMEAMAALYRTRALDTDFSNFWGLEVNHSAPADDYYNYGTNATHCGSPQYRIGLSYPYSRVYQTVDPSVTEGYRNASGDLFFVHHYSLNEHALQDGNITNASVRMALSGITDENYYRYGGDKQIAGYFCSDFDHAGRAVVLSELWAMAVADPTILARLYGTNLGQLDSGYFREFNLNYLSLPAQPGTAILGGRWGDAIHVRRWDVPATNGAPACAYFAVINTGLHAATNNIAFTGASGHVYRTVDFAEIYLDENASAKIALEPLQMVAFRTIPPDAPAFAVSASALSTTSIGIDVDVLALPSSAGYAKIYCSTRETPLESDLVHAAPLAAKGSLSLSVANLDPGVKYYVTAKVFDGDEGGICATRATSARTASDPAFPFAEISAGPTAASTATLAANVSTLGEGATSATLCVTVQDDARLFPAQTFTFPGIAYATDVPCILTNLSSLLSYTAVATITNNLGNGAAAGSASFTTAAVPDEDYGAGRCEPGLNQHWFALQAKETPDLAATANGHDDTERVLYPLMGATGSSAENSLTGNTFTWTKDVATGYYGCYAYEGAMYFEADTDYNFFIRFCDNGAMTIDGERFIENGRSGGYSATFYGTTNYPSSGWHHVKVFFWSFDGSRGPQAGTKHGLGWNKNGVAAVSNLNAATDWHLLEDPGDGSFLRTYDPRRTLVELDKPLSRIGDDIIVPVSIESFDADNALTVFISPVEPTGTQATNATWWSANGASFAGATPSVGLDTLLEVAAAGTAPAAGSTIFAAARLSNARTGREDWSLVASYTRPAATSVPEFTAYLDSVSHPGATFVVRLADPGAGASAATATVAAGPVSSSPTFSAAGATRVTLSGLAPGTAYTATVAVTNSAGAGATPVGIPFSTPAPNAPASAIFPSLVSFTNMTFVVDVADLGTDSTSATILFELADDASFANCLASVTKSVSSTGAVEFPVGSLASGAEYHIRATVSGDNGKSAITDVITVPTKAYTAPIFGAISASESWPDATSLAISLSTIGAGAQSATLRWTLSANGSAVDAGAIHFPAAGTESLSLDGLTPETSYTLAMSVTNSVSLAASASYAFTTPAWLVAISSTSATVATNGQSAIIAATLPRASAGSTLTLHLNGAASPSRTWDDIAAGTFTATIPAVLGTTNTYTFAAADATGRYTASASGSFIARRSIIWFDVALDDPSCDAWPDVTDAATHGGTWLPGAGDASALADDSEGRRIEVRASSLAGVAPLPFTAYEPSQSNRNVRMEGRTRFSASATALESELPSARAGLALHIDASGDETLYAWNGAAWTALAASDGSAPPASDDWAEWVAELEYVNGVRSARFTVNGTPYLRASDSSEWLPLANSPDVFHGLAFGGIGAQDDFRARWYSIAPADITTAIVETNSTSAVVSVDVDRIRDGGSEVLLLYGTDAAGFAPTATNAISVSAPGAYTVTLENLSPEMSYWLLTCLDGVMAADIPATTFTTAQSS
ncbi:MAG: hypothetical protein IJP66_07730, partial [Kiritimatiellae bacterium]|nr:hypothetical protein [Kiritimatiellia bacterium]